MAPHQFSGHAPRARAGSTLTIGCYPLAARLRSRPAARLETALGAGGAHGNPRITLHPRSWEVASCLLFLKTFPWFQIRICNSSREGSPLSRQFLLIDSSAAGRAGCRACSLCSALSFRPELNALQNRLPKECAPPLLQIFHAASRGMDFCAHSFRGTSRCTVARRAA